VTKINQSSDQDVTRTKTKKRRSLHAGPIALRANYWLRVLFGTLLTFICNAFYSASFIFPVDHPPFLPSENCSEDLSFKELSSSWHYWSINHITLLIFFSFFPILSLIAVLILLPIYFHAETFSSPRTLIWSETSLFFESPVRLKTRWKYKSLLSDFDYVFSTIPNIVVHFDQLVIIMNFKNCSSLNA